MPQQTNSSDCGIFACIVMRALLRREPVTSIRAQDMPYWRAHIALAVLKFFEG